MAKKPANKGNAAGRRGLYKEWITEEGLIKLEGYARDGLSNKQIAHNIGIREETIYTWMKKYPQLDKAIKKGKEVVDREVENALLKRALGYEIEETKTYMKDTGNGKQQKHIEKTKKHIAGDTTAMIFWLKNRKREEWNEKFQLEHSGGTTNTVSLEGLEREELKALANMEIDSDADTKEEV